PLARSTAPAGSGRAPRSRSGGWLATTVPRRRLALIRPRCPRSLYAAATVAGLTPSAVASSRTVGSRSPGASRPSATPASIVPARVAAPAPGPILCTRGIINMYYNKDSRSRRRFRRPVAAGRADPAGGPEQAGTGRGAGLSRAAGVTGLDQAAGRAGTTA